MTVDRSLGIGGLVLGLLGLIATIWAVFDGRRQQSKRAKAVIAARSVIERARGTLVGIKPSVSSLGPQFGAAIDDCLEAIKGELKSLSEL